MQGLLGLPRQTRTSCAHGKPSTASGFSWVGFCSCHRCYRCSVLSRGSICETGPLDVQTCTLTLSGSCTSSDAVIAQEKDYASAFLERSSLLSRCENQLQVKIEILSTTRQDSSSGVEGSQTSLWAAAPIESLSTVTISKESDIGSFAYYKAKLF